MQSLSHSLNAQLSAIDPHNDKLSRIVKNNVSLRRAILRTWAGEDTAARVILSHINSMYLENDTSPAKKKYRNKTFLIMGIYVDDSLIRSEINARRELLQLNLRKEGVHTDEIRIIASKMGMKERHLFSSEELNIPQYEKDAARPLNDYDQKKLLTQFRRALCLATENIDTAKCLLEQIDQIYFERKSGRSNSRSAYSGYIAHLCVKESNPAQAAQVKAAFAPYEEAICSRARSLGLNIGIAFK